MEDEWAVDKLDGSNWITWKFQLRHLLMAKGLWKYVDGSAVLAEDASAEARAKHCSESQKVFSIVAMSVSTSQLYLITSCEQPQEAWTTLKIVSKERLWRTNFSHGYAPKGNELTNLSPLVHQLMRKTKLSPSRKFASIILYSGNRS